jgi:predicted ester cyclase
VTRDALAERYRSYIDCLNRQDWAHLGDFVDDAIAYNGIAVGLTGYRQLLEDNFRDIPDLHFAIAFLISDPPRIASRLKFNCRPRGILFDLPVNGKRVEFAEHALYDFSAGRIREVWSIIDKAAIARQI